MSGTSAETASQKSKPKPKLARVVITRDNMAAMMALVNPDQYGCTITLDDIKDEIERMGVVHGVDWNAVQQALDSGLYETPTRIAVGTPARKGKDATFEYAFETDAQHAPEESDDGRIDYRSINFIQNVREGTVLVRKTPPTDGEDGCGVNGKIIPGTRGRDIPFKQGKNTRVSEDGLSLVASTSGAVVFSRGAVSVNDVTSIQGDVDMAVGNISCIGSVRVGGEIKAGFVVNSGGNLEVAGNVADCSINCEGNILVKGGCYGKGAGLIKADGDVVVKYAEGMTMVAGNDVVAGEELLNCRVTAKERVVVKSRKGKIIGGEINAGKEIRVPIAGNEAGTATVLRVGYDAELMREFRETCVEIGRIEKDLTRVKTTLVAMYKLQMNGGLDDQKQAALTKLEEFQASAPKELERLAEKRGALDARLKEVADAQIIIEDTLYHGVAAHFGTIYREFTESQKRCRITLENGRVILSEYRPEKA